VKNTPARRHHYLPQTYLAGFTDTGRKDGRLHAIDVQTGHTFTTSPANVGAERDFNVIDDPDKPIDVLETALSQFETPLADALRRIRTSSEHPSPEDLNWILNLLSLVATRNPRRRAMRESTQTQLARIVGDLVISDRQFFETSMRRAREQGDVTGPEIGFEEMRAHVCSTVYEFSVPVASHHAPEFRAQGKVLKQFGRRSWSLLLAAPGARFVCCDHPVSIIPNKNKALTNLSFSTMHTVVFFPLGSRIALHGSLGSGHLPRVTTLSADNVARANTRMWNAAARQVYCDTGSFQIVRRGVVHTLNLKGKTVIVE
jgi:hypothetical protein